VSPVKYKLGVYITEDDILHSDCREKLKSYVKDPSCAPLVKHQAKKRYGVMEV
jgi:hypothetical protein